MSKFSFEDYRQPWETGPHWELKREFLDKYKNKFPVDRLLCLAQAYSNIELMDCRYPEPVMLQIHELSKPLHGYKRFRESSKNSAQFVTESNVPKGRGRGKRKISDQGSDSRMKLIKFCSAEGQTYKASLNSFESLPNISESEAYQNVADNSSSRDTYIENFSSNSLTSQKSLTCISENISDACESGFNTKSVFKANQLSSLHNSNLKGEIANDVKGCNASKQSQLSSDKVTTEEEFKHSKPSSDSIINKLGLDFFQKFVQEIVKKKVKDKSPISAIQSAAQAAKCVINISFEFTLEPDSKPHAPQFCCNFSINNFFISEGRGSSKKKAKLNAAESGIDNLLSLSTQMLKVSVTAEKDSKLVASDIKNESTHINNASFSSENSVFAKPQSEVIDTFPKYNYILIFCDSLGSKPISDEQENNSVSAIKWSEAMESNMLSDLNIDLIHKFSQIVKNQHSHKRTAINTIHFAASILNVQDFISFNTSLVSDTSSKPMYSSNLLIKNILISTGKDVEEQKSKTKAAELAVHKFCTAKNFIIKPMETTSNEQKVPRSNKVAFLPKTIENKFECKTPINKPLLDSSFQRQFALIDASENAPQSQRNFASLLSKSASFCQQPFSYNIEDIPSTSTEPYHCRADVLIGGNVISTGVSYNKQEAKKVACALAVDKLRKLVYTIKVKREFDEDLAVKRNQITSAEEIINPFTENNIGCKMLKTMGWTGGGIGKKSGILKPISIDEHSFGRGLGYTDAKCDARNFRNKIETLLQDFSRSSSINDLTFSVEFSKEERKIIHKAAAKYNLHTCSYGKKDNRRLCVRRRFSVIELLENLAKSGGSTAQYKLIDTSKINMNYNQ